MTECAGWFGKILGHHFKQYILKAKIDFTLSSSGSMKIEGPDSINAYMDSQRDSFEIRCKRCGRKVDE